METNRAYKAQKAALCFPITLGGDFILYNEENSVAATNKIS